MKPRRSVSVLLQTDGALESKRFRVPLWLLRGGLGLLLVVAVVALLGIAFYGPVAREAARVPGLERELDRLRTDNARIRELAAALDSLEVRYRQVRELVGADLVPDPLENRSTLPVAPAVYARIPGAPPNPLGPTQPTAWPLDERGYLTRGQIVPDDSVESHSGLDIAVPVGVLVRASGGGRVIQAGEDPSYGLFVLISHPDGLESMYGHLSRIVVGEGQNVNQGEAIGRSGNTGRSSAPHLHFEIRRDGVSIDPATLLKEVP